MRQFLTWVVVIAVTTFALSLVAAPYVAFFALRSAADARDVQGLNQLVDFDAVRGGLKTELTPGPAQPAAPPSIWKDPLGALKSALHPLQQPAPDAEPYLTPKALGALTRGEAQASIRPQPYPGRAPAPWPSVRYWGVNRCRLAVHADGHGDTLFTFERRGPFTWKLVQIGLPGR
jgi:hypothetical protein